MQAILDGQVVLVTGAASGIGRSAALALATAGASVVVSDIDTAGGQATVSRIVRAGGDAWFIPADVRDGNQVHLMVDRVLDRHGRIDGAFNNAGILEGSFVPLTEQSEDLWTRVIDTNLRGVWLSMKHEIPPMLAAGRGVIVNHASVAGLTGNRLVGAAYIASKHGVVGLTRAAALEYAEHGLRINAICPGIVDDTVMSEAIFGADGEREQQVKRLYPAGRVGTLAEVAQTVVWLFSEATSFITGHALPVDGGLLAQ